MMFKSKFLEVRECECKMVGKANVWLHKVLLFRIIGIRQAETEAIQFLYVWVQKHFLIEIP